MIGFLLVSALGLGISSYLRKSSTTLRDNDLSETNRQKLQLIQKQLREELQQAVFLNPSCTENPAPNRPVSTTCSSLKVRGGVMPFPGADLDDLENAADMSPPLNLTVTASSLTGPSDGLRIVSYGFQGSFNCPLNRARAVNPSSTAGQAVGAERLWADLSCAPVLEVGGLYVLTEVFDTNLASGAATELIPYSNLFQITALTVSGSEVQVDLASVDNRFNQIGGLGLSGFTNSARIYPVRIIEWAVTEGNSSMEAGLYRRELAPSAANMSGDANWTLVDPNVEGVHFSYTTVTPTSVQEYTRTLNGIGSSPVSTFDDGVEDIVGVAPRVVIRSPIPRNDGQLYSNPLVADSTPDSHPRVESKFTVELRNSKYQN
jgi:hypothetical protein